MSQKTNPTSLRIASKYKNFYSCWYSDYFYSEMLSYDLKMRSYIESICDQTKHSQASICFQNNYKRFFVNLFLFDARGIRYSAEKALRLSSISLQRRFQTNFAMNHIKRLSSKLLINSYFPKNLVQQQASNSKYQDKKELDLSCLLVTQNNRVSKLFKGSDSSGDALELAFYKTTQNILANDSFFKEKKKSEIKSLSGYHFFLENNIESMPFIFTTIYPIRVLQEFQNAEFLAGEIVHLLQKRAHFRQIKDFICRKVEKNSHIKGMRLSCSGRVGGRSKKAQKAKTQSVQWGETSLHVFSSKLDFASKSASTLFGKVGVKVWLCYK